MTPSLAEFARDMAAHPVPASGSAAAYALALAAALAEKVARRSEGFDGDAALVSRAGDLRERALELVAADHDAVRDMLARGEPGPDAIAVPRDIAELASELARVGAALEEKASRWLLADSVAVRELAGAASQISAEILRSNA